MANRGEPRGRSSQMSEPYWCFSAEWRKNRLFELLRERVEMVDSHIEMLKSVSVYGLTADARAIRKAELVVAEAERRSFIVMLSLAKNS